MRKKGSGYEAFCPNLALIREGQDPLKLKNQIERVADSYVRNVIECNLSEKLLNQSLPKEYMGIYYECLKAVEKYKEEVSRKTIKAPKTMDWTSHIPLSPWGRSRVTT